jgi:tetratricopeptide (TPR) repeat protein
VLYAANGQYDKARTTLDMAIRTNPTYATALENLGDIYAKLASQAYDKALQIDPGSNVPQPKLTLVRYAVGQHYRRHHPETGEREYRQQQAVDACRTGCSPCPGCNTDAGPGNQAEAGAETRTCRTGGETEAGGKAG